VWGSFKLCENECGVLEKLLLCRCRKTRQGAKQPASRDGGEERAARGTGDSQERVEACKVKLQNGRDRFRSKRRWEVSRWCHTPETEAEWVSPPEVRKRLQGTAVDTSASSLFRTDSKPK
jgi:hypothetical protein